MPFVSPLVTSMASKLKQTTRSSFNYSRIQNMEIEEQIDYVAGTFYVVVDAVDDAGGVPPT